MDIVCTVNSTGNPQRNGRKWIRNAKYMQWVIFWGSYIIDPATVFPLKHIKSSCSSFWTAAHVGSQGSWTDSEESTNCPLRHIWAQRLASVSVFETGDSNVILFMANFALLNRQPWMAMTWSGFELFCWSTQEPYTFASIYQTSCWCAQPKGLTANDSCYAWYSPGL